jgi:hypothetical protein
MHINKGFFEPFWGLTPKRNARDFLTVCFGKWYKEIRLPIFFRFNCELLDFFFKLSGSNFSKIFKRPNLIFDGAPGVESLSLILPIFHESFLLTAGFFPETENYLRRHPVIGVYRFYENWSTETFIRTS